MNTATVLIGIQARSTSKRLPGKCYEPIGSKRLLDHVIDAAKESAAYINLHTARSEILAKVALLIPVGDPIEDEFKNRCHIVSGPEDDVLTRYKLAAEAFKAHFVVRITGDCPLIPSYLISKHITLAVRNNYDYLSNSDELSRTSLDGIDCEVMSKKMLDYMDKAATLGSDREHVTPLARREPPQWAKRGCVVGYFDHSSVKLSVDTKEDLERVRAEYQALSSRLSDAERRYGRGFVHRF